MAKTFIVRRTEPGETAHGSMRLEIQDTERKTQPIPLTREELVRLCDAVMDFIFNECESPSVFPPKEAE